MDFKVEDLLTELKQYITAHVEYAESLIAEPEEQLQYKKNDKSWSVLECLEHLNLYA